MGESEEADTPVGLWAVVLVVVGAEVLGAVVDP